MKTLRSALGVILGYLVGAATGMGVVAQLFGGDAEPGTGAVSLGILVFAVAQVLAGFLAGTIAGRKRLLHAGIVAGLFALVTVASLVKGSAVEPTSYRLIILVVGTGAVLVGGRLARSIRLRK
ncbi:MAG: hypothetical protein ACE5GX_10045 [Thermoanaerobaculia bacterium]